MSKTAIRVMPERKIPHPDGQTFGVRVALQPSDWRAILCVGRGRAVKELLADLLNKILEYDRRVTEFYYHRFFESRLARVLSQEQILKLLGEVGCHVNGTPEQRAQAFRELRRIFDCKVYKHYDLDDLIDLLIDIAKEHGADAAQHYSLFSQEKHPINKP